METEYKTLTNTELMEAIYDALVGYSLLDYLEDVDCPEGMAILKAAIAEIGQRITIHAECSHCGVRFSKEDYSSWPYCPRCGIHHSIR